MSESQRARIKAALAAAKHASILKAMNTRDDQEIMFRRGAAMAFDAAMEIVNQELGRRRARSTD
jgi:hypothetical protein